MNYQVREEDFCQLMERYHTVNPLDWGPLFVQPAWLRVWWNTFNPPSELCILSISEDECLLGVAPLQVTGDRCLMLGSTDVSDYVDFPVNKARSREFFAQLLPSLRSKGIKTLELAHVRPESAALTDLVEVAKEWGCAVHLVSEEVSLETQLPATWDEYLKNLSKKQRHEVRRKLRRLTEAGTVNYRSLSEPEAVTERMPEFLEMFAVSRSDKEEYLNPQREDFFRSIVTTMAQWDLFRLGMLELDGKPVAMLLYFDYQRRIYLYNSGYDPAYRELSVGLMSKVLCIKDSIARGREVFDFLKGDEVYKYRLGGKEVPLTRCQIDL